MRNLEIFVLTRDRPAYLKQSLLSILRQSSSLSQLAYKIIVSDNSVVSQTNDDWFLNNNIEIRRRGGALSVVDHFNTVLSEVTADFFLMLHDDDLLCPNYFERTLPIIMEDSLIIAVAVNGYCFSENDRSLRSTSVCGVWLPKTMKLERYFRRVLNCFDIGIPPVSGFLFSKLAATVSYNSKEGGKHCDVSFIGKLIQLGRVVQLKEPLVYVREHEANDSNYEKYNDRMSLMRHIANVLQLNSKSWQFMVYRWECTGRGLASGLQKRTSYSRTHKITQIYKVIACIASVHYMALRVLNKLILRLQFGRNDSSFKATYLQCRDDI